MCTYLFAKKAPTLHLARGEGRERYFGCNLMQHKVLASSYQHLMAEAPNPLHANPCGMGNGLLTTRLLHLNAGVDLDHESARNESVFQLPVFLGGDYDSSRTTPGAFAELIVEPGHLVLDAGCGRQSEKSSDTKSFA